MGLKLELNGQTRDFEALTAGDGIDRLVAALGLKSDRVAVEHNGDIVSRSMWTETALSEGDKLEVVHFVGGGRE